MESHPDWHCRIGKVTPKGNIRMMPGVRAPHLPARMQPKPEIVKVARDLLRGAEDGTIQALACAFVGSNGFTYSNWAGGEQFPVSYLVGSMVILADDLAGHANREAQRVDI